MGRGLVKVGELQWYGGQPHYRSKLVKIAGPLTGRQQGQAAAWGPDLCVLPDAWNTDHTRWTEWTADAVWEEDKEVQRKQVYAMTYFTTRTETLHGIR